VVNKDPELESQNVGSRKVQLLISYMALAKSFNLSIYSDIIKEVKIDDL
jgi:hypothetical protein